MEKLDLRGFERLIGALLDPEALRIRTTKAVGHRRAQCCGGDDLSLLKEVKKLGRRLVNRVAGVGRAGWRSFQLFALIKFRVASDRYRGLMTPQTIETKL